MKRLPPLHSSSHPPSLHIGLTTAVGPKEESLRSLTPCWVLGEEQPKSKLAMGDALEEQSKCLRMCAKRCILGCLRVCKAVATAAKSLINLLMQRVIACH
jgi:hypothetical protein